MSTKLVPFTTRPLSTSRHGITRLSSMRSVVPQGLVRLFDGEETLVQGLAGDHAGEVQQPQLPERAQVVERGDPAGIEEAPAHDLADALYLGQVGAAEQAVPVGVRVHELVRTLKLEPR